MTLYKPYKAFANSSTYVLNRELHASNKAWRGAVGLYYDRMDVYKKMHSRSIYGHYGCVNAIEFTKDERYIISGGDDKRILVWNSMKTGNKDYKPIVMSKKHRSNIFTVAVDCYNSKIFSGGNDNRLEVHDFHTGDSLGAFRHADAIYSISACPDHSSLVARASEDGEVALHDVRCGYQEGAIVLANTYKAFHSVQFHPLKTHLLVTANSKEGVALYDVRKPLVVSRQFSLKYSAMSARFNRDGSRVLSLRRRSRPTLFDTETGRAICRFDAKHYYNSCTMKTCSFGGPNDEYVFSGSDDFTLYMWKIPTNIEQKSLVRQPHMALQGHRSIVNQVRYNYSHSYVASSGVEKVIKLWSPFPVPGEAEELLERRTRRVYSHEEYIDMVLETTPGLNNDIIANTNEDPRMLAFFDTLVQREVGGWTSNSDRSSEDQVLLTSFETPLTPEQTDSSDATTRDEDENGRAWILRLIEKKRAQLKSARRKRLRLRRRHAKLLQLTRRIQARHSSHVDPSKVYSSCRHSVAPYTMVPTTDGASSSSVSLSPNLGTSSDEDCPNSVATSTKRNIKETSQSGESEVSSKRPRIEQQGPSSSQDLSQPSSSTFAQRKFISKANFRRNHRDEDE